MSTVASLIPVRVDSRFHRSLRIFMRETRYEFTRLLRTRSYVFSIMGFPIAFYIFFGLMMNHGEMIGNVSVAKYVLASYAVFGIVGASFYGVGIALSSELAAGWLELKRASPMPPAAYVLSKYCSAVAFGLVIVSILSILGVGIGHISLSLLDYARMSGLAMVGVIPFASMGMALGLFVPFNSAPGITNLIYLPMSFCGGLWVPIMFLPGFLQKIAPLLPTYHLGQLMLRSFGYASVGSTSSHWIGLVGFTMLMLGISSIGVRRLEANS